MPRKIFISYKYGDRDVRALRSSGLLATTARHYVDELAARLDANDHIYKGENDNESLAEFKDETIASRLRDKIFDTSITLVLISKCMKDAAMNEDDQWIPWEISYSLKEMTKGDKTSRTNGVVAIVLPDKNGNYEYFVKTICQNGCMRWERGATFGIIGKNMFNRKRPKTFPCANHPAGGFVHSGSDHSYIYPIRWDDFISNINEHVNLAIRMSENLDDFELEKTV